MSTKKSKPFKKRKLIIAIIIFALWAIPLGFHFSFSVHGTSVPKEPGYTSDDFVNGDVSYFATAAIYPTLIERGIPYLLSYEADVLPYSIYISFFVDGDHEADGFVLQELICIFDDGSEEIIINTTQSNSFLKTKSFSGGGDYRSIKSRESKAATFAFSDVVKRKGPFEIKYRGHFAGNEKSIEGILGMVPSRSFNFCPGWLLLLIRTSGV